VSGWYLRGVWRRGHTVKPHYIHRKLGGRIHYYPMLLEWIARKMELCKRWASWGSNIL